MNKKEVTTKEDLLAVISILENADITYWMMVAGVLIY